VNIETLNVMVGDRRRCRRRVHLVSRDAGYITELTPLALTWAEIHRLQGNLLLADNSAAEACYVRALEVARAQEARSFELRAACDLARLWRSQGETAEARDLIAPVYGWFTEGFGTADLQEAKALLSELSQAGDGPGRMAASWSSQPPLAMPWRSAQGRFDSFDPWQTNGTFQRMSPVAARSRRSFSSQAQ
jgi:hypothetical protein